MALSVVVYEDNDLLRESIVSMISLNKQFQIGGAFNNVLKVEEQVKSIEPDIILMDIDMPGSTGIDAVAKIRKAGWQTPIMMLTVFDDNQHVFDAICAGASGYLLKKHLSAKLYDSIEELRSGGAPMPPSLQPKIRLPVATWGSTRLCSSVRPAAVSCVVPAPLRPEPRSSCR